MGGAYSPDEYFVAVGWVGSTNPASFDIMCEKAGLMKLTQPTILQEFDYAQSWPIVLTSDEKPRYPDQVEP